MVPRAPPHGVAPLRPCSIQSLPAHRRMLPGPETSCSSARGERRSALTALQECTPSAVRHSHLRCSALAPDPLEHPRPRPPGAGAAARRAYRACVGAERSDQERYRARPRRFHVSGGHSRTHAERRLCAGAARYARRASLSRCTASSTPGTTKSSTPAGETILSLRRNPPEKR